jgi:hypothetical protein
MCLYSKKKLPKVSKQDVVCYKVLKKVYVEDYMVSEIRTPYENSPIGDSTISGIIEFRATGKKRVSDLSTELYGYKCEVSGGYIHTCKTQKDAKCIVQHLRWFLFDPDILVYKCVIPAGTRYFEGATSPDKANTRGYASEQIRFVKEIKLK